MIACSAPHVPRTLTENINYYTIPPSFPVIKLQNRGFEKEMTLLTTRTQQRNALAIQTAFPLGDGQQSGYSSSFRASRRQNPFYSPLVDLDHVTYTCPTGLTGLPVQSRTHCLHGMVSHRQSSHLTQVDVTHIPHTHTHTHTHFFLYFGVLRLS